MTLRRRATSLLALGLAVALGATACGGGGDDDSAAGGSDTIRFGFNWSHDIEWASYYLAEQNGWFADEGVDVDLVPGGGNTPAVTQLIAAGEADMGVSSDELQIINANEEGGDYVVIAATYQRSPYGLTWMSSTPISGPADLAGKRIGGHQGEQPRLDAVFTANGLTPDYTFVPMDYDPQPLVDGEMDVITSYSTNQPIALGLQGEEATAVTFSDFGLPSYGDLIFASRAWLDDHRAEVTGFLRALLRGVEANQDDPEAGVQATLDAHGEDAGLDPEYAAAANPAYIALLTSDWTDEHGLLSIDPDFMADQVFAGYEAAGETDLPPVDEFVDMSFLDAAREG